MKRKCVTRILALALSAAMLAGCGTQTAENTTNESASTEETSADASQADSQATEGESTDAAEEGAAADETATGNPKGGYPWIDSMIAENVTADMEISPKEDFYLYVNKDWILKGGKKAEEEVDVNAQIREKIMDLVENEDETDSHDTELLRDFYYAYTDWEARDAAGMEPLRPVVEDISSIKSLDELTAFLSDEDRSRDILPAIRIDITTMQDDPEHYSTLVHLEGFDNTLLRDRAAYNETTKLGEAVKASAAEQVGYDLESLGWTAEKAQKAFEDYVAFEAKLFDKLYSLEEMSSGNFVQEYKSMTQDELQETMKDFPIKGILKARGFGDSKSIWYENPEYLELVGDLYTEENLEMIKNYYLVGYLLTFDSDCDSEARGLCEKTNYMISYMTPEFTEESKAELPSDVENVFMYYKYYMGNAMDKAYLARHDCSELKAEITDIFEDTKKVYHDMLSEQDWLSEESKKNVLEKIDAMGIYALYRDNFTSFDALDFDGKSYFEMVKELRYFKQDIDKKKVNAPIDNEEAAWTIWDMFEDNAKNIQDQNKIIITLGLVENAGYTADMSKEELLARVGAVMGHEMSHGFDLNGVKYDKNGDPNPIFTEEDQAKFQEKIDKVIKYYDGITVFEGHNYEGKRIDAEATADLTGMEAMVKVAEQYEDFDYKKFFEVYADYQKYISSYEFDLYSIKNDVHPLNYLRANIVVQQLEKFYETYDVKEGDTMYLAPEDRICVWEID